MSVMEKRTQSSDGKECDPEGTGGVHDEDGM
jgi:hypothetical protein